MDLIRYIIQCYNVLLTFSLQATLADQSPAVSRRIGFSSFPLSCLLVRILIQTMKVSDVNLYDYWKIIGASLISYLQQYLKRYYYYDEFRLYMVKIAIGMRLIWYTKSRNLNNDYRSIKNDSDSSNQDSTSYPKEKLGITTTTPSSSSNNKS